MLIIYLMLVTCPMLVTSEVLLLHSDVGVLAPGDTSAGHRDKRHVTKSTRGFTEDEKLELVQRHNYLRSLTKASNMLKMEWDPQLATLAQNYANQCKFEHSNDKSRSNVAGFSVLGENLYAGTADFDPASVVQDWYDEVNDYNYATNKCKAGAMCGHYTQVVWANSRAVGCGVKYCEKFRQAQNVGFSRGYIVVCNYGPGGNYIGQKPYATGKPCTQCPSDRQFCSQGLCVVRPSIGDLSLAQIPASGHSMSSNQPFVFTMILSLFVFNVQINKLSLVY